MGRKIFISYKFRDHGVRYLNGDIKTTPRQYVDVIQERISNTSHIDKAEKDDEDMSDLAESTIKEKLYDRIYDTTVTVVLISPNMKEQYIDEKKQWIYREMRYSIQKEDRNGRVSGRNSIIAVYLPDVHGNYDYVNYMPQFDIIKSNIKNGYFYTITWDKFINGDINDFIESADINQGWVDENDIVKE